MTLARHLGCYRCGTGTPGFRGICRPCADAVKEEAAKAATSPSCSSCGHPFTDDWERIQHEARGRHNYRAWSPEDRRRAAGRMEARR